MTDILKNLMQIFTAFVKNLMQISTAFVKIFELLAQLAGTVRGFV